MNALHLIGFLISVALIASLAIYTGIKGGRGSETKNGALVVSCIIMVTLVGGSSTIGTAQLAYNYGLSAWWFTLGSGIACLIFSLVFASSLRSNGCPTLVGMLRQEYGTSVGMTASVLNSVGTFINIISQLLSASAVVLVLWPQIETVFAVVISAVFMVLYVIFGGTKGAGVVGILKLVLLYISMVTCGMLAFHKIGGIPSLAGIVHQFISETGVNYSSIFARGINEDLGACFSLILGVLTTQTYAQGILSGKTEKAAKAGGLISAFLIPPIGAFGILVGLYMRSVTDPATFVAKTALTQFVLDYLPPVFGGIVLGTLFIASVGTGAGLALGVSIIINNDIIKRFTHYFDDARKNAALSDLLIVVVLAIGCCMSTGGLGDTILKFAFMSMGLRGAVVFLPLCFSLWLPGKVSTKYALCSVIVAPILVFLFGTIFSGIVPVDSLFIGVAASALIMFCGLVKSRRRHI